MTQDMRLWAPEDFKPKEVARSDLRLFALNAASDFGQAVSNALKHPLSRHEERDFEDGEHKSRPLDCVAKCDTYVIQSLYGGMDESANDRLCRLLFFIGALKDAGAERVTIVVPYLCYARKDRRTKPNDPVTTRYIASILEAVGTDAIVALEVHNPAAFENAFRGRTVALTSTPLFVSHAKSMGNEPLSVVSPDTGGAKRAELLRLALEASMGRTIGKGFAEKYRSAGVVTGDLFVGDVKDSTVFLVDDLISTGGTLARAARAARAAGARKVVALATHGLFMTGADEALADPCLDQIVVTDTVPPFRLQSRAVRSKLHEVSSVPLIAETIGRLHDGNPLSDLLAF